MRTPQRSIVLPADGRVGEVRIAAGRYRADLVATAQGPAIELSRDGQVVVRELAVQPVRRPGRRATGAWLWRDNRDERMFRVYVQRGRELYFITVAAG